jgi:hypothetical protein
MGANRKYKSSVFITLFDDPEMLMSLYNAVTGSELPLDTPVEMVTLEDVLFTDRRNDIAFLLAGRLVVLLEHQSSICENMPLRMLIYAARVYERIIDGSAVYKQKLLKIPRPDFIVLYNGAAPYPDETILRLSDAYNELPEDVAGLGGALELEVRVVNINEGRNRPMLDRCEPLGGYAQFVGKVRENKKKLKYLKTAVTRAVEACIAEGILADFLKTHSSEVINMLTTKWKLEDAIAVWRQESREEGREEGVDISAQIMRELIEQNAEDEIAERYQVSIEKVNQLKSVLARIPS